MENDFFKPTHPTKVWKIPYFFFFKPSVREAFKNKKINKYGIFHTLVGWVGLKKSFSIKNKNKKHGLKMPKIA